MNALVASMPGSQLVVSVNGLLRRWTEPGHHEWNPTNAAAFIRANKAAGYNIFGWGWCTERGGGSPHTERRSAGSR